MSAISDDIMKEADKLYLSLQSPWVGGYSRAIEDADKEKIAAFILSERQRTSDLIEEVKRVLGPFAQYAASITDNRLDTGLVCGGGKITTYLEGNASEREWKPIYCGHFRAGAALLSKLEGRK